MEDSDSRKQNMPKWVFPGVMISLCVFLVALFWFYAEGLNQFRSSNKQIVLTYTPAKEIAREQAAAHDTALPARYIKAGKYPQAIALLEESIKTLRATGKEDALLADNLQEVGKCYVALGKYAQAEPYYRDAVRIYARLGNYPPKLRKAAEQDYAAVLKHLGQVDYAKPFESKED